MSLDVLMNLIVKKMFQHVIVALLLSGYVFSGAFGPNSVQYRLTNGNDDVVFTPNDQNAPLPEESTFWGLRRHLVPENRIKSTHDVVLFSGLVPEYKQYHVVVDVVDYDLPTSSSHYTPRPRDPPLL